jgi:DNA-directed RNA polymerase specialized sigma24 family protein
MTTKKQKRVDELKAACEESDKADRRAVAKRQKKFRSMLRAHEAGAATYRDLAEISGLSEIRVAQILREQREKRDG